MATAATRPPAVQPEPSVDARRNGIRKWLHRSRTFVAFSGVLVLLVALFISAMLSLAERQDETGRLFRNLRDPLLEMVGASVRWVLSTYLRSHMSPINGTLDVDGLRHPVEILRDHLGIPHIYGRTFEDVLFGQGFVHAQDRLWEMEMSKRVARGRISEVVGEAALPTDRFLRTLGFTRLAQQDLSECAGRKCALLSAYVRGINAYLHSSWFRMPIELMLLGHSRVEDWTELDTLTLSRFTAWQMSKGWSFELTSYLLIEAVGEEAARELFPQYPDDLPFHIPKGTEGLRLQYFKGIEAKLREAREADVVGLFDASGGGSNAWVVSGDKTVTGKPLLHNDPHLPLKAPGLWYAVHLDVTGIV